MKPYRLLIIAFVLISPFIAFSDIKCDGNTYEINQCLKSHMKVLESKIDEKQDYSTAEFKKYRDHICTDISSKYQDGTYQSVKYGNCIVSLDKWYINQTKR